MADLGVWTLVADFEFWTLVAIFWISDTSGHFFRIWTPVADFGFWTLVADLDFGP